MPPLLLKHLAIFRFLAYFIVLIFDRIQILEVYAMDATIPGCVLLPQLVEHFTSFPLLIITIKEFLHDHRLQSFYMIGSV